MFPNEGEEKRIHNDAETDYLIHEITADPEDLAYGLNCKLTDYENHYNLLQNKYKYLALTWMLSTFIAIGYILSGFEKDMDLNNLIAIMLLCVLASIGIFLLWFLDAGVYHKLIESIFNEIIKLEKKFPVVGSYHQNILKLHDYEEAPQKFHGIYYSYFIISLLLIAALCLCVYLYDVNLVLFIIVIALFAIAFFAFLFIHKKPVVFHKKK